MGVGNTYLRFDEDEVDEEHNEVMLDVLVSKFLAVLTLCESHALAECTIVSSAVGGVKDRHWVRARDADWHHYLMSVKYYGAPLNV